MLCGVVPIFLSPSSVYTLMPMRGKKAPGALQLEVQGTWTSSPSEILLDAVGDVHWAEFTQGLLHSFKGTCFPI